jgi:transposase-like protein
MPCREHDGMDVIEVLDAEAARRALAARLLRCPGCGGRLRPWGRGRPRKVRALGGAWLSACPDRARCCSCQQTHVVLPAVLLPRRAYSCALVGSVLARAAHGDSTASIAAALGVPAATVRGWVRRGRRGAQQLWERGVKTVVALDPDTLPAAGRRDPLAAALDALAAAADAVTRRLGIPQADLWAVIAVITGGALLPAAPSP